MIARDEGKRTEERKNLCCAEEEFFLTGDEQDIIPYCISCSQLSRSVVITRFMDLRVIQTGHGLPRKRCILQ